MSGKDRKGHPTDEQASDSLINAVADLEAFLEEKRRTLSNLTDVLSTDTGNKPVEIPILLDAVDPKELRSPPKTAISKSDLQRSLADLDQLQDRITSNLEEIIQAGISKITNDAEKAIQDMKSHLESTIKSLSDQASAIGNDLDAPSPDLNPPPATPDAAGAEGSMATTFNPHTIEQEWYRRWEQLELFKPSGSGEPYCIMLPPPNVTGSLHMGHAFQDTLMDILTRYHRMRGRNTLWQCGTDHAGIATQMVVERQLAERGESRQDLGREKFTDEIWRWKEQSGGTITQQLRRMGTSMDWTRERFTMDQGLSQAVTEVFCRLYDEGLIYRGKRLVNWDPVLHTAISDLEVISEEESGHLWHMRYPLKDAPGHLVVATTRPETMLGDAAVAVHPGDARYTHLIGSEVVLPLTGRTIPVVADDYVDPEFGSGCVKITPAHDFNDYEVGCRHNLPMFNIFTPEATINENGPAEYAGLDRYEARRKIIEDLEALGLLDKIEDHKLMVPRGDRSQAVIEPYLTNQWYVKVQPLAEPAIEAVENGRIRFIPENWSKTYFDWMHNIRDWCISRQLWWGHRIPAWYDEQGTVHVGRSEQAVREQYGLEPDQVLKQDPDVLDTWFSSALWPFSTLGWPEETPEIKTFYPTTVLVTGFDIIFFWVARMIMMGLKFADDVPFREVYIHGLVRDAEGQKMSKSKGNILDPIDLIDGVDLDSLIAQRTAGLMRPQDKSKIEKATRKQFPDGIPAYGTDALRFTFAALATQGRDIRFDLGRIEGNRNFCNKLWNAARYVMMATTDSPAASGNEEPIELRLPERWITSRLQQTELAVKEALHTYRFDLAAQAIHEFIWDEYCDWYVELSKSVLNNDKENAAAKRGTRRTLIDVLETILRLTHPFMPYVTEEIWQRVAPLAGKEGDSIMLQDYPQPADDLIDSDALREVAWLKTFILGVRRIRAEMNISPAKPLRILVLGGTTDENQWLRKNVRYVVRLAKLESVGVLRRGKPPESATALAGDMTILIPLADIIDPIAERDRLHRELDKLRKDHERSETKLSNPDFAKKAPDAVVTKEKTRRDELVKSIARLQAQLITIESLIQR